MGKNRNKKYHNKKKGNNAKAVSDEKEESSRKSETALSQKDVEEKLIDDESDIKNAPSDDKKSPDDDKGADKETKKEEKKSDEFVDDCKDSDKDVPSQDAKVTCDTFMDGDMDDRDDFILQDDIRDSKDGESYGMESNEEKEEEKVNGLQDNIETQKVTLSPDEKDEIKVEEENSAQAIVEPTKEELKESKEHHDGVEDDDVEENSNGDDDDASLSDLLNNNDLDEDYVAVTKTRSDELPIIEEGAASPNSSGSYVMVNNDEMEKDEEEKDQYVSSSPSSHFSAWIDPLSLPSSTPPSQDTTVNMERDESLCEYQEEQPNYIEEDEVDDDDDVNYPNDFEEEDGFVMADKEVIQEHLHQQQQLQQQQEHYETRNRSRENLKLEPRVAIAVALKVVNILRRNGILDGHASGQVKDKIFGGNEEILRAVVEFTMTRKVERLVKVIHGMSL